MKYELKRASKIYNISLRMRDFGSEEDMERLVIWKRERLKLQGKSLYQFDKSTLPNIYWFFKENNMIKLYDLMFDDKPVASCMIIRHNEYLGYYMPSFEMIFAKFSPSNMLLFLIIKEHFKSHDHLFLDLMKGAEDYKKKWLPGVLGDHLLMFSNYKIVALLMRMLLRFRSVLSRS